MSKLIPGRRWKLWWYLDDWQCYGYRYKWVRTLAEELKKWRGDYE